jgi:hypothetical protein
MTDNPSKICLGIPSYGNQPPDWWVPMFRAAALLHRQNIELIDVLQHGTMMVDFNRNKITRAFLDTEADWLFWVDADNINPFSAVRRLLDTASDGKTIIGGIYFSKKADKPLPIAYVREENGTYAALANWEPGEILELDALGMNCVLTHRGVFEDIDENYVTLRRAAGGTQSFYRKDIQGDIFDSQCAPTDGKIIDGVLHDRFMVPETPIEVKFFELHSGRTEDIDFFEKAKRCGHKVYLDTSVICEHLTWRGIGMDDYRHYIYSPLGVEL